MTSAVDERPDDLEARYGRTKRPARRANRWGILVAALTVAVIAFWGLTTWQQGVGGTLTSNVVNFRVPDAGTVEVDLAVTVQPGTDVVCALEATNVQHLVVGWDVVPVPATEASSQLLTVDLRTTQEATTVVVKSCWVP